MRYIDNGTGDGREEALFPWLRSILTEDAVGIRWQSGYFEASVLGLFMPTLRRIAEQELDTLALIGSNDGETQSTAVHQLVDALGLPRPNAQLGVVRYSDGFFHPKTIHVRYGCGREVAYIGSSNMTARGINGLNVEAGIVLDTDEGDPVDLLTRIRAAVGEWFVGGPDGLFVVSSHDDVNQLEQQGILTTVRTPRGRTAGEGVERDRNRLPSRGRRHRLPPFDDRYVRQVVANERETADEVEIDGDVLVAELAGPGRWSQAAFPQWFIHNFFEALPDTDDVLRLHPVTEADGVGEVEEQKCGFKSGSRNWYYELGLAAEIGTYPQPPNKPIGVFHRTDNQTCRYTIIMPDDESYELLAAFLAENRDRLNRHRNELSRTIVQAVEVWHAWPDNWFFEP